MSASVRSVRHERLRSLFDPAKGHGLEIGPLFDPVVSRAEADVKYVDVHGVETLRSIYRAHPGVPVADIVDPDFVLIGPDGPRTLPMAVGAAAPFDWLIASHVIEHVPDLVGWLREAAEILTDDGRLVLAVPDRRYSFDAGRTPTTVGEALLAHDRADQIPSVRAVYDHFSRVVTADASELWAGRRLDATDRMYGLDYVSHVMGQARDEGIYVDCHVWLFTPQSFVEQLAELAAMDLLDLVIDEVVPTATQELEFYAVLRRLSRDLDAVERRAALDTGFRFDALDSTLPVEAADAHKRTAHVAVVSARELRLVELKRAAMTGLRRVSATVGSLGRGVLRSVRRIQEKGP